MRLYVDLPSCVRALKHALKHPLTMSKAKPTTATRMTSLSSSLTSSQLTGNYLKKKVCSVLNVLLLFSHEKPKVFVAIDKKKEPTLQTKL